MRFFVTVPVVLVIILLLPATLQAEDAGRLTGIVSDVSNGQVLPGAHVVIIGTNRGASTDLDGKFSIIGIPAGEYTVRATYIGYQTVEVKNLQIIANKSVTQNFKLMPVGVTTGEVVVEGEKPMVNAQATAAEQTISSRTIEAIPNAKGVEDVMALQPGVVKLGGSLFLRGGRANEIQYLVDGVPVNDILGGSSGLLATTDANSQLQQLYAGVQSGYVGGGASGLAVSAGAIQSVTVSSSGFDAEFGNAQSGVINIITKSGSDKYIGSMQYRGDRFMNNGFNEMYTAFSVGGPEPITSYLLPMAGVSLPGKLTFFINTDFDQNDGPWHFADNAYYNPLQRKIKFGGFFGSLFDGLGFKYRDYLNNRFTFDSKLKFDMESPDQIVWSYRTSLGTNHGYNHYWEFRADSSGLSQSVSSQAILQYNHFFGSNYNSLFRISVGRLSNEDENGIGILTPPEYSWAISQTDPNDDAFGELGTDQGWSHSLTTVWTGKADFQSQMHPLHLVKMGTEFNYEAIQSTEIQYPTAENRNPNENPAGEYPGYGLYRWVLNNYTNRGDIYLQDNIEYQGMNIHLGLRYDYFYPGKQIFATDWVNQWELATNLTAQWPHHTTGGSSLLWYLTHGWFSPRLSLGYPITEQLVFYFNYGHFYQLPDRGQYFRDPFTLQPGGWIGNPDLKPQKTVQYEAGFDDAFLNDMSVSVRGFYKDIYDYSTLAPAGPPGFLTYLYVNLDYASTRGVEVTLNKTLSHHYSGSVAYSFQVAKGRSSSPYAAVYQPQFQLPRETRLDWDQNHTVNLFLSYRVGPQEDYEFFGLFPLNNWGISLTWSYGSGFPFTPYNTNRSLADLYLHNSADGPYSSLVNLTMYKGFYFFGHLNMLVTLDVTNVLNRRNPSTNSYVFNNYSGQTYQYGDYDPNTLVIYPWRRMEGGYYYPWRFGDPRQILLGIKLNWD
jgi:outer membrane receptor protein involved in Fe transport